MNEPESRPAPDASRVRPHRRRRRGFAAALVAFGVVLAAASFDFWSVSLAELWLGRVDYALRRTAPGRTVEWEGLAWSDASSGLRVRAAHLRVSAPWRLLRERKVRAEGAGWEIDLPDPVGTPKTESTASQAKAWETWVPFIRQAGLEWERRVGELRLRGGILRFAGEEIEIEDLWVKGGVVSATFRVRGQTLEVESDLQIGALWGKWRDADLRFHVEAWPDRARAELDWAGNQARLAATFAEGEWLPATWRVTGDDWRVPAQRLGVKQTAYDELTGNFEAKGDGGRFAIRAHATARPKAAGTPPLRIEAAGGGDEHEWRLERLELEAPQAKARLSAPIGWVWHGGWNISGEPVFAWEADLAPLSGGELRGRIAGDARWSPGGESGARLRWEARGSDIAWRTIENARLTLRGESDAGATTLAKAIIEAGDGSRVDGRGRFIHATRAFEGLSLRATIRGDLFKPWLPDGASFGRLETELKGGGVWPSLSLDGFFVARNLVCAGWTADEFRVEAGGVLGGRGKGRMEASRGGARLAGQVEWTPTGARVGEFFLRRSDGAELHASEPAAIEWTSGSERVEAVLAEAGKARLAVKWRADSDASVQLRDAGSDWLNDWRSDHDLPAVVIRRLEAKAGVDAEGWLWAEGELDALWRSPAGEVWAKGEGRLDAEGARIAVVEAGREDELLLSGAGFAPWRFRAGGGANPEATPVGHWDLKLETRPGAAWWNELAQVANLGLEGPELSLRIEGDADAPRGTVVLGAGRMRLRGEGLPEDGLELRSLRAEAVLAKDEWILRGLRAAVDGQAVEAEGRLAFAKGDRDRLRAHPYLWLRDHAEARVSIPRAEVAAFARYLPTLLAPQGELTAELRLGPGARLDGILALSGAATRPLGGFGVLQDVEVALKLAGLDVRIEKMRATAGGQELVVTGGARRVPGRMPALDLEVKAKRFPLLRKPGLLLRGDLDLSVKTLEDGRTKLGGEVRLRDSLFLADIRSFIGSGGGRGEGAARSRPPYFSVETPPLADWELGLRVGGERFLRMRTPVFEGTGSARFDLAGTMREPRAAGEVRVDRGSILFPFASFSVQEGAVRLKASDPYTPVLDFRATGRRLGYDLRLELAGTAEAPQMQLTSSPPLDAETVLLMVSAGSPPEQGVGAASGTQRLAAVGAYVGRDLLRGLGLGGTDEERLTLSSGEKVSRAGRETYGFEFKLTDDWALTGEYDEFDAYNVGVRRRFGPRPGAADERTNEAENAQGAGGSEVGDGR